MSVSMSVSIVERVKCPTFATGVYNEYMVVFIFYPHFFSSTGINP